MYACQTLAVLFAASLCSWLIGCSSPPSDTKAHQNQAPAQTPAVQVQRFDLKGKVMAIDKVNRKLTVDHEAIPGFMGAMTLGYPVKDEQLLDNLSQGEQVTAKVVSTGSEYWLEDIAPAKPSR